MTTRPGFSSRSTASTFQQFPQRDGATVSDIAGMEQPGWSNGNRVDEDTTTDAKAVDASDVEDKSVAKQTTARKTAQKKG